MSEKEERSFLPVEGSGQRSWVVPSQIKGESEELGELYGALAKAQAEMEVAKTDSENPYYKSRYADLASITKAARGALTKHGLCVVQRVMTASDGVYLSTRLGHQSGQWMESRMPLDPPKKDIHSMGSYITYLRRYTLAALVGIVASGEDDDGEGVISQMRKEKAAKKPEKISKENLKILSDEIGGDEGMLEYILKVTSVSKLSDIPMSRYTSIINWVREKNSSGNKQ